MTERSAENLQYTGRIDQIRIYLKKFLRMFVYQSDWKVLPIGAVIAALVTFVVGANMFVTQEGTTTGTFALACVCIWNGFFNSIQVVCRERDIVKREHRSGMEVSSYIIAHMLYQLLLCFLQTLITLLICVIAGIKIPGAGVVTPWGIVDVGITILLVTYTAANLGFSTGRASDLYLPVDGSEDAPTVAAQEKDPASLLNTVRAVLSLRHQEEDLQADAEFQVVCSEPGKPFVYRRGSLLCAVNPSGSPLKVILPEEVAGGLWGEALYQIGECRFEGGTLTAGAQSFVVIR